MFFSKKKKRKRFLCLRILCFFGIKGDYSVPQTVMSNYLNTTICFDLYGWHAQKIQKLSNSTPRTNGHRPKGKVKGRSMLYSSRPERAEAPSPGQHPGYNGSQQDALKGQKPYF